MFFPGGGGSATIWGPSRASEAVLVTHLDGLRGLTPAPNRGAATDTQALKAHAMG